MHINESELQIPASYDLKLHKSNKNKQYATTYTTELKLSPG